MRAVRDQVKSRAFDARKSHNFFYKSKNMKSPPYDEETKSCPLTSSLTKTTTRRVQLVTRSVADKIDNQNNFNNFFQGCEFSPDGLCILTCTSVDHVLHLYNTPPTISSANQENEEKVEISPDDVFSQSKDTEDAAAAATHEWKPALTIPTGDTVRSYTWYPHMNSYNPTTCIFACSTKEEPVQLYDAYTGISRATYRPYNAYDEMESPTVVTFTPDGNRIFTTGFLSDRTIHIFDIHRPGRDSYVLRLGKTRRSHDGQKGLVSSLAFPTSSSKISSSSSIFAVGTYSPGSIYIYDDRISCEYNSIGTILYDGVCVVGHGKSFSNKQGKKRRRFVHGACSLIHTPSEEQATTFLQNSSNDSNNINTMTDILWNDEFFSKAKRSWYQSRTRPGVTQLTWGHSEFHLYSSSRRSDSILVWDLRMLSGHKDDSSLLFPIQGILSYPRNGDTNQRIQFTLRTNPYTLEEELITGSYNSCILIYNAKTGQLLHTMNGFEDVVNGVSINNNNHNEIARATTTLLAVAVGGRNFTCMNQDLDPEGVDGAESDIVKTSMGPSGYLEVYNIS